MINIKIFFLKKKKTALICKIIYKWFNYIKVMSKNILRYTKRL